MNLSARIACRGTRPNWVQRHVAEALDPDRYVD